MIDRHAVPLVLVATACHVLWDLAEPRLEMPNAAAATVSSSLRKQRWLPLPSRLVAHTILDRLQKLPQPLQTWLHWLQPQLQG